MTSTDQIKGTPFQRRDPVRWLTFTSFWGSAFYLLSCASLAVAHRKQPLKLHTPTLAAGMGIHVATFMAVGSLSSAAFSLVRGRSTSEESEERISSGQLEQNPLARGLGSALGSAVPLALAIGSMRLAERITGEPAFANEREIAWPRAVSTMASLSGLAALAVNQITSWVARDAQEGPGSIR